MPKNISLMEKELWKQKEVAGYFRVSQGTIINWRKDGIFSCCRMPGKRRVLYYRDEVIEQRDKHTISKKGGDKKGKPKSVVKENPVVSTKPKKVWRI